ncbi:MAG: phytanoyl-CoA dioxygenase family protein, partial [Rhizobiales bacterium]|nr:phytanoyl-CoA dioxygenase family protein [Hyphomicrobiales bacterium]
MLTQEQIQFFETEGYLVVEDVLDQATVLDPVRAEYSDLLDGLYDQWHVEGKVPSGEGMSFHDKLLTSYKAQCEWFQPMDISLPGGVIAADTPFHFGPAVLNMLTAPKLLDVVESLIGPEITSNPIQHVRIKPPATDLRSDESRAHITKTDWHQDKGVTLETADQTTMITVWIAVTDATEQ